MQYKIHMGSQLVHCNFSVITFILLQFMGFFKSVQLATKKLAISQGSTLAMCPLARMHFLGRRASSGHNNSFYAGPRGQWVSDR